MIQEEAQILTTKQLNTVFGASGTIKYAGQFLDDYNPQWNDSRRYEIVEEMRKGDATVKAGLNLLTAPMLATEWSIQGGKDEHKEYVEQSLFGMERSWKEFLRQAFTYLPFGFSLFEIVLEIKGGEVRLKDLAPRIQKSIDRFQTLDQKKGVTQLLQGDLAPSNTSSFQSIPFEKLLWFVNEQEGDDLSGTPIIRSAYSAWYNKTYIQKIANIACERYGVGVPYMKMPNSVTPEQKKEMEELLRNIRSNENNFLLTIGEGYELEILAPKGNPQGAMMIELIRHYDRNILLSMLAQSADLGSTSGGSYALEQGQKQDLLMYAEQQATYFEDYISSKLIRMLIDLRFGKQEEYPYLTHEPLGKIDKKVFADSITTLTNAGLVVPTAETRKYIHNVYKLPELQDDEIPATVEQELRELENKIKLANE